jgi:hypothetical protein
MRHHDKLAVGITSFHQRQMRIGQANVAALPTRVARQAARVRDLINCMHTVPDAS